MPAAIGTPFEAPLPDRVPPKFWINTNAGLSYALYSLVRISTGDLHSLLQTIRFHAEIDTPSWAHKVVKAPSHDFWSNGSRNSLRDVYDCHTSMLDEGDRGFAPSKFIVVAHPDWEIQGVLLVDLDCRSYSRGTVGIMRLEVAKLPQALMVLEASNWRWSDLKAVELEIEWSEPILGYTDTKWQYVGHSHHDGGRDALDAVIGKPQRAFVV